MDIKDFPHLSREEFSEACHNLDRRYCQATLGPVRRRWRLRICAALDTLFFDDGGYSTYIQITRPLEHVLDHGDLSLDLDKFSFSEPDEGDAMVMADQGMLDNEEADSAAIVKHMPRPDVPHVTYEIHLHPTYRVPCLWFSLHNLPPDEPAFNIDTVFRRLVPDEYKDGLRGLGGIGGISADHHPITGVPAFFVHPCLLGDAISSFQCSRENYLMIWLGLVGGCVGLWVPKEMAQQ
ncbi:autophagy-like protein 3 [Purpureocillium lilacinum]|uniref:Ubiquitin-like-conjugating enzyme ATG10 n=1 Tax=Purpureocillium lilacinum TaxID=33203 RepID=A0A179HQ40_PURLI|nr:autophagy-like protein 3 [Purpureocillium lilacinum]OAQ91972.1 autophagy-like protein 3 [Purpureocillium lilacinum]PWI65344.1 hypothetical protein PCL_07113 [Purpureocillium lilacinum]